MRECREVIIFKHSSGYWRIEDANSHLAIGPLYNTELAAYKAANRSGFIVI